MVADSFEQAVALVVADSFEQACAAAALVPTGYRADRGRYVLAAERDAARPNAASPDMEQGDFVAALTAAPATVDATYTTPDQTHAMMEPHASLAWWEGERLTVYVSHQQLNVARIAIAATLRRPEERVRVLAPFVAGSFGKGEIYADPILAALAARAIGRPVKIAIARAQIANHTVHRAATIQRVRLAAARDGRLLAIGHETLTGDQPGGTSELDSDPAKLLYGAPAMIIATRLSRLDLPRSSRMRAPGDASGLLALECAMDELAERLGMDPMALRLANDTQNDPVAGPMRPFADRRLAECLRRGAARFGWQRRKTRPDASGFGSATCRSTWRSCWPAIPAPA